MIAEAAQNVVNVWLSKPLGSLGGSVIREALMNRRKRWLPWILGLIALSILAAGCARGLGGREYSRRDARQAYNVEYGEVVRVEPVTISGEYTSLGTTGGGLVGYSLGRVIGDGSGSRVAGAVGGVAGAVVGREVEKAATTVQGLEITVDLDRAGMLLIVQSDDVAFVPGERVRVIRGRGDEARVLKP
jgi:outer membrane lipoprotein SlyB